MEPTRVIPAEIVSSAGRPLDPRTRSLVEERFGHDFQAVRVHTDARAASSARAIGAAAYTVGEHIVFGSTEFAPTPGRGLEVLAHELTHVVQQRVRPASASEHEGVGGDESEELEARTAASRAGNPSPRELVELADPATRSASPGTCARSEPRETRLQALADPNVSQVRDEAGRTEADPRNQPVLHVEARHDAVRLLKEKLIANGAKGIDLTRDPDLYSLATWIAVRKFQWSYGLDPDGVVGKDTWTMLVGPPVLDLDRPDPNWDAAYAASDFRRLSVAGQHRRRTWGDWGNDPPVGAVPGEYGDTWTMVAGEIHVGGTPSWQHNNPGNILPGLVRTYPDALNIAQPSGLAIFPTYDVGWRRLKFVLKDYYADRTISNAWQKYLGLKAGQRSAWGDNPEAYARSVTAKTGLDANRTIAVLNESELEHLMDAIQETEGWVVGQTLRPGQTVPAFFSKAFATASP
jgi:Domain of unknown function (DUF4157)/Putative peptidoglycan binding domain